MKNILKISLVAVFALLTMFSCKDDDLGTAPGPVTELTAAPAPGGFTLKWKNPLEDVNFEYVKVEYIINGEKIVQTVSKFAADPEGYSNFDIDGFPNQEAYTIKVLASNNNGATSSAAEVTGNPDKPIFELVAPTVEAKAGLNSIELTWYNEYEKQVKIEVTYTPVDGSNDSRTATIISEDKNGVGEVKIPQVDAGKDYNVSVLVKDRLNNNNGNPATFVLKPIKAERGALVRDNWDFPGYDAGSDAGKIGYSSQATNEGEAPKGRVKAMLDGDAATFWHTKYSSPAAVYPHFFIIDLQESKYFTEIGILGRKDESNRKNTQIGQRFFTCTFEGDIDANNVDDLEWVDHGFHTFDHGTGDAEEQLYDIVLTAPVRYLKVYFGEEAKGSKDFAMVAEINLYALMPVE